MTNRKSFFSLVVGNFFINDHPVPIKRSVTKSRTPFNLKEKNKNKTSFQDSSEKIPNESFLIDSLIH
jgi:hypothetical protein